jgi:predicted nucleic acid-binding OB-fold protein
MMNEELRFLEKKMRLVLLLRKEGRRAVIENVEDDFRKRRPCYINEVLETMIIEEIKLVADEYKIFK